MKIETAHAKKRIPELYGMLHLFYGPLHWWPADSPWEVVVGVVLTQNCAWRNVDMALKNLKMHDITTPEAMIAADENVLLAAIRPAGFFNQKKTYLQNIAQFFLRHREDFSRPAASGVELAARRKLLLGQRGIGEESADSILLYAFDMPFFVIDAYTRRIASHYFGIYAAHSYSEWQRFFSANLPHDVQLYNEFHAALVELAKNFCLKNNPVCEDCPLHVQCRYAQKK